MTSTFESSGSHRSLAARLTGLGDPKRVGVERVPPGFGGEPLMASLRPFRESLVAPQRGSVDLMLAAVVAFLLLACANSSALMATRASVRQHERAVRASRTTLARQGLIEASPIALVGGVLGLGLALGSLDEQYLEAGYRSGEKRLRAHGLRSEGGLPLLLVGSEVDLLHPVLLNQRVAILAQGGRETLEGKAVYVLTAGPLDRHKLLVHAVPGGLDIHGAVDRQVRGGQRSAGWGRHRLPSARAPPRVPGPACRGRCGRG